MKLTEFVITSGDKFVNGNHIFATDSMSARNIAKHVYGKDVACANLVDEVNNVLKKGLTK